MKRTSTYNSTQRKKPTLEWVGFLPETDSFHRQVFKILSDAGFDVQKMGVNQDSSMVTFWVKQHPPFKDAQQGRLAIYRLLRTGGIHVALAGVAFWLDTISMGAFIPPQHKPSCGAY